ncbi:MAG: hypothetical protein QOI04_2092 [Verrucomicrobiota bacterium]|jgi:4-amino-4-deoxy-L-arabinose transferase-like glycosyltransferase
MTARAQNLWIVLIIWAAIYLPALGSLEIKGEEGRRILPAVTMLETGNYIVPQVGSRPYLSKPPLINWIVAASFKIFGARNEWTARIPSALCVLAVALAFITAARASLGENGSLMAALIWLTNFGMIEKGRLIEIEALYVSLFGLAIIFWLSAWQQKRSTWMIWIPASIFLGLGLLAKGPLHLFFFYGIVVALLWQHRQLRMLFSFPHLIGIVIMLGIFAAWAVPYLQITHAAGNWSRQFSGRLSGEDFKVANWLMNIPRGLAYFLPWLLLAPFLRHVDLGSEEKRKLAHGLGWGTAVPFFVLNLAPGSLPRYSMPALVPATWLLSLYLNGETFRWPRWIDIKFSAAASRRRFVIAIAITVAVIICLYAIAAASFLGRWQKVKPIAAKIDNLVPASEKLYAIDPEYQPFLFYVRAPIVYASDLKSLPTDARYLLVQPQREIEAEQSIHWLPRRPVLIFSIKDYRNRKVILLEIREPSKSD